MIERIVIAGLFLLGVVALAASFVLSWHAIPVGFFSKPDLVIQEAPVTSVFRYVSAAGCVFSIFILFRFLFWRKTELRALSLGMLFVILLIVCYPYIVINWCDSYSGSAAWLQQQHDTLTWLGGDVYRAHSDRYQFAALSINAQDIPFRLAAYRPPVDSAFSIGVSDMKEVIGWFGYGPSFLQFIGKGWVCALLGSFSILCSTLALNHRQIEGERRGVLLKSYAMIPFIAFFVFVVFGLSQIHIAGQLLRRSKTLSFEGQYEEASTSLKKAVNVLPALSFDTGVILQAGYYDSMLDNSTSAEAKLFIAVELGKRGLKQQAVQHVKDVLNSEACTIALKRESCRLMLHAAIDALNSGDLESSKSMLDDVLLVDPSCLIAHFHRQLLSVKLGNIELNRSSHKSILDSYHYFQRKEKKGVLAASWFMLAQGEYRAGNISEASIARRRSKGH